MTVKSIFAVYLFDNIEIYFRWQSILRTKNGKPPLNPHLYLQGWLLQAELSGKARIYENLSHLTAGNVNIKQNKIKLKNFINKYFLEKLYFN